MIHSYHMHSSALDIRESVIALIPAPIYPWPLRIQKHQRKPLVRYISRSWVRHLLNPRRQEITLHWLCESAVTCGYSIVEKLPNIKFKKRVMSRWAGSGKFSSPICMVVWFLIHTARITDGMFRDTSRPRFRNCTSARELFERGRWHSRRI
jgi:hypothetical protein